MPPARPLASRTLAALLGAALAAPAALAQSNVDLPRYPALSPDGDTVVFSWRGDLWRVATEGGEAVRLTSHPANEGRSAWTPDGAHVVFESNRDGVVNLWSMRPDGTDVRQVSDLDRSASLSDVATVDGAAMVMFSGGLELDVYREARPFMVPLAGGPAARVHDAFGSHPVLSPDGTRVLFARGGYYDGWERRHYRGAENQDVWIHDLGDGSYTRLTEWEGNDGKARWLDDDTVLYLSDRRDRTVNLYRRDLDQPESRARKLTDFDGVDIHDWTLSEDGRTAVLMSWDALYRLDLTRRSASPQRLAITASEDEKDRYELKSIGRDVTEAALSPDGKVMAVVAYGEVYVRALDGDAPTRRVTESHAREKDVAWSPDGLKLYFTSDRDGTESIYAATVRRTRGEIKEAFDDVVNPDAEEATEDAPEDAPAGVPAPAPSPAAMDPITGTWTGTVDVPAVGQVRFSFDLALGENGAITGTLSSDALSGTVNGLYTARTGAVRFDIALDDGMGQFPFEGRIEDGRLEGTVETGEAPIPIVAIRRMPVAPAPAPADEPETPADDDEASDAADDDPMLDPERWQDAIDFTIEPVVARRTSNDREPAPSPDGRHLAFRGIRGSIHLMDLETGDISTFHESWDAGTSFAWSPDGRMIAYATNDLDFNRDIWIAPVDGSFEPVNITRHPDNDASPSWTADGKWLCFTSERVNEAWDVWLVALDEDLDALTGADLDEYLENAGKAAKKRKPLPVTRDDGEEDDERTTAEVHADLDLDTAYLRLRRITRLDGNETRAIITPGAERIVFTASGDVSGLFSVDVRGRNRRSLGGSAGIAGVSLTGDKVVLVSGRQAATVSPNGGSPATHAISSRMRIDLQQQSSQKFKEAARGLGEGYYHPTMNGVSWADATRRYHELAMNARTSDEFNWIANRFVGELNGSHLSVRAPGDVSTQRESHGYLGTTERLTDAGFEVLSIMEGSPADDGPMALHVGDVITAVDFEPIDPSRSLDAHLAGRVGEETVLGVRRTMEDGAVADLELLLTPTSFGAMRGLAYEAWVMENKRLVDEWSDGRLGYIHMQGMNQPSLDVFERDLYAAAHGKDGVVLDVRNNGGGWTTDRVLSSIMVESHAYTVPRGASWDEKGHYPQDRLFIQRYAMPMNLLCNEKSYSNAEIMSHAFKTLERGTLVGQATHGSVISTGGFGLIDGTFVRLPFRGWFVDDGTDRDMELNGAVPDLLVPQTPEAETAGADEQLRAAVDDLLERLD